MLNIKKVKMLLILSFFMSFLFCSNNVDELQNGGQCADIDPVTGATVTIPDGAGAIALVQETSGHTHIFDITLANAIIPGAAIVDNVNNSIGQLYTLAGSNGHTHTITVSSDRFFDLRNNRGVQIKTSKVNGHVHEVIFNCN